MANNWIKVLTTISFVLCAVDAVNLGKTSKTNSNRKLLRLETAAPYPAAGFKPDIAFELPTETETQTNVATQLDVTTTLAYEEIELDLITEATPLETYLPAEQQPEETYGPPLPSKEETPEDAITENDNTSPEIVEEDFEALRLPQPHSRNGRLSFGRKLAKPIK